MIRTKTFITIDLGHPAVWKITPADPDRLSLKCFPGWSLFSPLMNYQTSYDIDLSFIDNSKIVGIYEDYAIVRSPYIVLQMTSDRLPASQNSNATSIFSEMQDVISPQIEKFIRNLRYLTKQTQLPVEPGITFSLVPIDPSMPSFPSGRTGIRRISSYELDTAITTGSLLSASELKEPIPIHDSLILDSIQAFLEKDYRRSLLYAAIAMETYVADVINDIYSKALDSGQSNSNLRIVCFNLAGGSIQKKDPIFSCLIDCSKNNFSMLLHEIPLYLLGKSLQVSKQTLFQKAIRLHKTRNDIVHRGNLSDRTDLFHFTYSDTEKGLKTVLDVCKWFGMRTSYPLPSDSDMELYIPEQYSNKLDSEL